MSHVDGCECVSYLDLEAVCEEALAEELVGHSELKNDHGKVEKLTEDKAKEVNVEPINTQMTRKFYKRKKEDSLVVNISAEVPHHPFSLVMLILY